MDGQRLKVKGGKTVKISEAKNMSLEEFSALDELYGGFDAEKTKNHPIREKEESFMDFMKKGSKKIKDDPIIKSILE